MTGRIDRLHTPTQADALEAFDALLVAAGAVIGEARARRTQLGESMEALRLALDLAMDMRRQYGLTLAQARRALVVAERLEVRLKGLR